MTQANVSHLATFERPPLIGGYEANGHAETPVADAMNVSLSFLTERA